MILFNELKVTLDGKHLVVDVLISDLPYYNNMHISNIVVETQDTFNSTGPHVIEVIRRDGTLISALYSKDYTPETNDDGEYIGDYPKRVYEVFDIDGLDNKLFFIWVIADGELREDTPCGMKDTEALGIAYNKYLLYRNSMDVLQTMTDCTVPRDLIDYILRLKSFEFSLLMGNYDLAVKYWNWFYANDSYKPMKNSCGCYGRL